MALINYGVLKYLLCTENTRKGTICLHELGLNYVLCLCVRWCICFVCNIWRAPCTWLMIMWCTCCALHLSLLISGLSAKAHDLVWKLLLGKHKKIVKQRCMVQTQFICQMWCEQPTCLLSLVRQLICSCANNFTLYKRWVFWFGRQVRMVCVLYRNILFSTMICQLCNILLNESLILCCWMIEAVQRFKC